MTEESLAAEKLHPSQGWCNSWTRRRGGKGKRGGGEE